MSDRVTIGRTRVPEALVSSRIIYSTDPEPAERCPRCGHRPCICQKIDLPARQQTAYIQRDRKRRKGKTVTVISGLQHNPATFKELLTTLKTTCGAGGTYKDGELEVQGDQRDKVAEKLRELGYKVKLVGG
jgi:translation initiation factor 1